MGTPPPGVTDVGGTEVVGGALVVDVGVVAVGVVAVGLVGGGVVVVAAGVPQPINNMLATAVMAKTINKIFFIIFYLSSF
jgi:hypothetical protein